jgi:8-oxo-dGTP pyrophosphatase MutT (NUDIX family)
MIPKLISEVREKRPWYTIVKRTFKDHRGTFDHDMIEQGNGASILCMTHSGKLVLLNQFRPSLNGLTIDIPGGRIEKGSTPEATARKELREEAGYECGKLIYLGCIIPNISRLIGKEYLYFAQATLKKRQKLEKEERIKVKLMSPATFEKAMSKNALPAILTSTYLLAKDKGLLPK